MDSRDEMDKRYIITPIRYLKWKQTIENLICNNIFLFSDKNSKFVHEGTCVCFHVSRKGICAHAVISSNGEELTSFEDGLKWEFNLDNINVYYNNPRKITEELRSKLDAFNERDIQKWSWFVQTTRYITENDFKLLIRDV
jgi:hypothetical protein